MRVNADRALVPQAFPLLYLAENRTVHSVLCQRHNTAFNTKLHLKECASILKWKTCLELLPRKPMSSLYWFEAQSAGVSGWKGLLWWINCQLNFLWEVKMSTDGLKRGNILLCVVTSSLQTAGKVRFCWISRHAELWTLPSRKFCARSSYLRFGMETKFSDRAADRQASAEMRSSLLESLWCYCLCSFVGTPPPPPPTHDSAWCSFCLTSRSIKWREVTIAPPCLFGFASSFPRSAREDDTQRRQSALKFAHPQNN